MTLYCETKQSGFQLVDENLIILEYIHIAADPNRFLLSI